MTNPKLDLNKEYSVSISHIVSINEFYVQSPDNLKELMDHQERIQLLADTKLASTNGVNPDSQHHVGDFVLAKYELDQAWYKGLVTAVTKNSSNNDYSYEVIFINIT